MSGIHEKHIVSKQRVVEKRYGKSQLEYERNIIHGDALTLKTVGESPQPIVFSQWSPVNGSFLKRRDFTFHGLLEHESMKELPLFSDLGDRCFIPTPEKEY